MVGPGISWRALTSCSFRGIHHVDQARNRWKVIIGDKSWPKEKDDLKSAQPNITVVISDMDSVTANQVMKWIRLKYSNEDPNFPIRKPCKQQHISKKNLTGITNNGALFYVCICCAYYIELFLCLLCTYVSWLWTQRYIYIYIYIHWNYNTYTRRCGLLHWNYIQHWNNNHIYIETWRYAY